MVFVNKNMAGGRGGRRESDGRQRNERDSCVEVLQTHSLSQHRPTGITSISGVCAWACALESLRASGWWALSRQLSGKLESHQ